MSITQYSNSHTLTLDIKKSIAVASQIPTYIQNDTAELLIKLLNNGQPYDYSTADRYVINFKRPDGLMVNGIGTYENGFIKYNLGSSEREIVGSVETSVSLFLGTSRISTRPFMIRVLKDYEEGIPSQEGYSVLQELFIEVDQVKASAETATANANNAASKITEFTYKGDYVSGVAYKQSNVVTYGGVNYLAIQNSTSIIPTDANYWKQVAPSVTNNSQTWVATEGQKTFTITNGSYVVGKGNIQVWVGGVFQTGFTESSETTISFSEAVPTGTTVYAKWFEGALSITKGHKTGHELGGQDELDVTKLKNFKENVTDQFTSVQSSLAEKATIKRVPWIAVSEYDHLITNKGTAPSPDFWDWKPAITKAATDAIALKVPLKFTAGVYRTTPSFVLDNLENDLVILGDGAGITKIICMENSMTTDNQYLFLIRNKVGSKIKVLIKDIYVDMNARNNPLPGGDLFLWQHNHAFFLYPRDTKGIQEARIESVTFYDLVADGVNFGGNSAFSFGDIIASNVMSSGRTRTRSDLCVTGSYESFTVSNCVLDKLEIETNSVDTSLKHSVNINTVTIRQVADLFFKGGNSLAKAVVNNMILDGRMILADFDFKISNSVFKLNEALRLVRGKVDFANCSFYAKSGFVTTIDGLVYTADTPTDSSVRFSNCDFDHDPTVTKVICPYYFRKYHSTDNSKYLIFDRCTFKGSLPVATFRSGKVKVIDCDFESPEINIIQGTPNAAGIENEIILRNNRVLHASGYLYQPPIAGNVVELSSRGNKSKSIGQVIDWTRYDKIVAPRGVGAVVNVKEVDDFESDVMPTIGKYVKGQKIFNTGVVAGGTVGWIATVSADAASAVFKTFGTVTA